MKAPSAALRVSVLLLATLTAAVVIARQGHPGTPVSDVAVIESYALLAASGDLMLGPYSRFQWHHPGPAYIYWMVPFHWASGFRTTGMAAGALALNLLSLATIWWVMFRCARPGLALAMALTLAWFVWRAAPVMVSPWNPHVPILPLMAAVAAGAGAAAGTTSLLPAVAFFASLAAQAHVALLPVAVAVGAAALASGWLVTTIGKGRRDRHGLTWALLGTAGVLVVLWALPIVEQLSAPTGNLGLLWRFFLSQTADRQSLASATRMWADMLASIARPDFRVASGLPFEIGPRWTAVWASVEVLGLLVAAAVGWRRGRSFEVALAALLLLATGIALWSVTEIRERVFDHDIFWIGAIGAMNAALLLSLAWIRSEPTAIERLTPFSIEGGLAWLAIGATCVAGLVALGRVSAAATQSGPASQAARDVADDVRRYLVGRGSPRTLIRIDQDSWEMTAGVVLQLQRAGVPFSIEDDWIVMFTPSFARTGAEGLTLMFAGRAEHVRLLDRADDQVVSAHDPLYVHVARPRP